ncbi:MAG: O-antigen ligase family protein [Deltaproteobacteria bacterium]|nr:O-antigen ligase family protein [Deltaproteobacteria bacterium]
MLAFVKSILKLLMVPLFFIGGLVVMLITALKNAKWGLFMLILAVPQPNIWYKFHEYPLGKDFLDLLFLSIVLGIFIQKHGFAKTGNSFIIVLYILVSYMSLIKASVGFSLPMPISGANPLLLDWKNYAQMIFMYFLALNILKEEDQQKQAVMLITAVVLLISVRSFRSFSGGESFDYNKRAGGPFEAVGLGANHLGAFIADYASLALAFFIIEREKLKKYFYLATCAFSLHPLFFSYSRGAYLAAATAFGFFGIVKKRIFLVILIVVGISWQTVLPVSVVDRIMMTENEEGELESSAAQRLVLWEHALDQFKNNPVFGIGFNSFGFTVEEGELTDTHNFYLKTLSEQGLIGISLLAILLFKAFLSGMRLYKNAGTNFQRALGLGFMGTVISMSITNIFGDRWSYFVLGGYFWILWGIVDRCCLSICARQASSEGQPQGHGGALETA